MKANWFILSFISVCILATLFVFSISNTIKFNATIVRENKVCQDTVYVAIPIKIKGDTIISGDGSVYEMHQDSCMVIFKIVNKQKN